MGRSTPIPCYVRVCFAAALLLCAGLLAQSKANSHATAGRVLPLNRFEHSRELQTDARGFYAMPLAVGDDYFDGSSPPERVKRHMETARAVGAKFLRCSFTWNAIEKAPSQYDWSFYDRLAEMAQNSGIELIPYVAYTPGWAASGKEEFWQQPPQDFARYAEFMEQAVRRYRGKIRVWEVWNEPDNREYWQGSAGQFAKLVKQTAVRMRAADPNVVIVLGGMSHGPSEFLRSLLSEHGVGGYVDVIAMHGYPESWDENRAEDVFQGWIAGMAELIRNTGSGADLWVNEMGYADYRYAPDRASKWGVSVLYRYEHTPEFGATSLFKNLTMTVASGKASLASWYRLDDFTGADAQFSQDAVDYHLGIVDAEGHAKPALAALRFFESTFGGPVRPASATIQKPEHSQAVVDIFERGDHHIIVAGWLRSSEPGEISDHSGMAEDVRRETVSVKLPCADASVVRTFDEQGRSTGQRGLSNGLNVALRGDHVVVADVECR